MEDPAHAIAGEPTAWQRYPGLVKVNGVISFIEDWMNLFSVGIIMFLMFFATAEIVGRYVFNSPIPGHVEIVELIMAGVVFLGIAYTERRGGHVRMELFVTRVLSGRYRHSAEALSTLLALFVYIFICYYSWMNAYEAFEVGDSTSYLYWPTWPSKICVPLGCLFLCIRFTLEIIQHVIQIIVGPDRPRQG